MKTDTHLVKDFTEAAGQEVPKGPKHMTKKDVHFIVKMMLDEIMELYATVADPEEYKMDLIKMIVDDTRNHKLDRTNMKEEEIIAEQADALVDCYYYSQNCAVKHGINLSAVFKLVHDANMAKRDPKTGLFIKREDGKIMKPEGWKAPDIVAEIRRQMEHGSFHYHE